MRSISHPHVLDNLNKSKYLESQISSRTFGVRYCLVSVVGKAILLDECSAHRAAARNHDGRPCRYQQCASAHYEPYHRHCTVHALMLYCRYFVSHYLLVSDLIITLSSVWRLVVNSFITIEYSDYTYLGTHKQTCIKN